MPKVQFLACMDEDLCQDSASLSSVLESVDAMHNGSFGKLKPASEACYGLQSLTLTRLVVLKHIHGVSEALFVNLCVVT